MFFPAVLPSVVTPSITSSRKVASFPSIPLAAQTKETPTLMFCSVCAISVELLVAYLCPSALYFNIKFSIWRCEGSLGVVCF